MKLGTGLAFIVPILISHPSHAFHYLPFAEPHLQLVWIWWETYLSESKEIHAVAAVVWPFKCLHLYDANFSPSGFL